MPRNRFTGDEEEVYYASTYSTPRVKVCSIQKKQNKMIKRSSAKDGSRYIEAKEKGRERERGSKRKREREKDRT